MPYLLSIDTSTSICSVALSRGTEQVAFRETAEGRSHAKILLPFIEEVLQEGGIAPGQLDAVAVSMGPGSYTGLRIGVSTAKGLCYALGIPLIGIPTLQVMAAGALEAASPETGTLLCPMLDARRMEVFSALYDNELREVEPYSAKIIEADSFRELLDRQPMLFCGNGMEKCCELLAAHPNARFDATPISARRMAALALRKFESRQFEDVAYCEPDYGKAYIAAKPNVKGLH